MIACQKDLPARCAIPQQDSVHVGRTESAGDAMSVLRMRSSTAAPTNVCCAHVIRSEVKDCSVTCQLENALVAKQLLPVLTESASSATGVPWDSTIYHQLDA